VLSRTTNFAARKFSSLEMLFTSAMPTHTKKNGALRALLSLKRANISAFCLCDRAARSWSAARGVQLLRTAWVYA
jgi:hypothetical protein